MPQRNGNKGGSGRSAQARSVMSGISSGSFTNVNQGGGPKKSGSHPSATGNMSMIFRQAESTPVVRAEVYMFKTKVGWNKY
tara:strand:+ start:286 stop:528 length:243 start_codon:yes stop_codon:yes gene_type:complete